MFEPERSQLRILSNIADAQGLGHARDLIRMAEHEFLERSHAIQEMRDEADLRRREAAASISDAQLARIETDVEPESEANDE